VARHDGGLSEFVLPEIGLIEVGAVGIVEALGLNDDQTVFWLEIYIPGERRRRRGTDLGWQLRIEFDLLDLPVWSYAECGFFLSDFGGFSWHLHGSSPETGPRRLTVWVGGLDVTFTPSEVRFSRRPYVERES